MKIVTTLATEHSEEQIGINNCVTVDISNSLDPTAPQSYRNVFKLHFSEHWGQKCKVINSKLFCTHGRAILYFKTAADLFNL